MVFNCRYLLDKGWQPLFFIVQYTHKQVKENKNEAIHSLAISHNYIGNDAIDNVDNYVEEWWADEVSN